MGVFKTTYYKIVHLNGNIEYDEKSFVRKLGDDLKPHLDKALKEVKSLYPNAKVTRISDDEYSEAN